jgi:NADH dehydrogenase (ubiquinone) 1 alpha subcomplex subunit 9
VRTFRVCLLIRCLTIASRNFGFEDIHVTGPQRIAHIAKESGVARFVQISHLNASPDSSSTFYRTKFEGEAAVKDAFPTATIARPAIMYGYEDKLLQNMAGALRLCC